MKLETAMPPTKKTRLTALFSKQSLTFPLAGVIIGLAAASGGLFHVVDKPITAAPAGYIALVNGQPILLSDFISQTEAATGETFTEATPKERRDVLRQMVDEELLVQRGLTLNLPETDTDVRTAIVDGVNTQVAAPMLADRPSDDVLRAYFQAHLSKYKTDGMMRFHDLVLRYGSYQYTDQTLDQAEADAAEAVYQLRSGAAINMIEPHFGFVESANSSPNDDEFDFAARIHLGEKVFDVASALGDGEVSEPVPDKDGVHVIVMERRQRPVYSNFDSVRNNVYSDYTSERQKQAQQDALQLLRKSANIMIAPGANE